jgi:hypothetical protein
MNDEQVADSGTPTPDAGEAQQTTLMDPAAPAESAAPAAPPPEAERFEFAMPEGISLDETAAEEWQGLAKELGLDQERAQKVVDIAASMVARQQEAQAQLVTSWVEQAKTDKEIGGDKLAENLGIARKALERFGTPELRDVLNMTGLGSHPEIIRAFYKAGKAISEDGFVVGAPKGPATDMAKIMFPTMN